jgi:dynein heavy chain
MALADEILAKLERSVPERLSAEAVFAKYPTNYEESMNTVLYQEIVRYNRLTDRIRDCIDELKKAVKGLIVMTDELETMLRALLNNQVP